jgi:benzodiazapine receptor
MQETVRGSMDRPSYGRNSSARHVLTGLAITAGAVALSALVARLNAPDPDTYEAYSDYDELPAPEAKPPSRLFAMVWPPLFMALTVSGLRVWNAPRSAARTQALTLWGTVQALNAVWMALGPRRLGGRLTAAVASLGASLAYAWRARQVAAPASGLVAPYLGWIGLANVLSEELWRQAPDQTLH